MLYFVLIYLIILAMVPLKNKHKIVLSVIPLFVITLLRYGIGADFFSYKYIYNIIDGKSFANAVALLPNIDKGFLALFLGLGSIGLSYQVSITLIVSILVIITMYWILENSENPVISVLLYYTSFFLVWHLSAIRQGIVLTIGSLILYNKKEIAKWKQVLIIGVLATFHLSALFLLVFLFIDVLKLNKKRILYLLIFSLCFTFLPLQNIVMKLTFLPGVTKFIGYIRDGVGFFDFSGISRLVLFFVVYVHYDRLAENKYYKHLSDVYLVGVIIYFILNFSDVASGRLFSYSFATSIILFPAILNLYKGKMHQLSMSLLMLYTALFGVKEINTIKSQTRIATDAKLLPTTTIFNPSQYSFNSYYYQFTQQMDFYEKEAADFAELAPDLVENIVKADESMRFIAMYSYSRHNYYIMNQKGEVVTKPLFKYKPLVYKHYLRMEDEKKVSTYYDLVQNVYITDASLIQDILVNTQEEEKNTYTAVQVNFADLSTDIQALIEFPESLGEVYLFDFQAKNDAFKVLKLTYYGHHIFMFLDAEGNLVLDNYYLRIGEMDQNGFFTAISARSVTTFYYDGTKIWMVKN